MLRIARVTDPELESAFAAVPREAFLGPPPWTGSGLGSAVITAENVAQIYRDVLIALDPSRGVNNGSPSLHALMLHRLAVRPGQCIAHIGAGGGYYTAILSGLVGTEGRIIAVEYDASLAACAAENLSAYANVSVLHADGALQPAEPCDRIYVNFGIGTLPVPWIDNLAPRGRLIFPLCASSHHGEALLIEALEGGRYAATELSPVSFVCAEGSAQRSDEPAVHEAFRHGGAERVRSLIWRRPADPSRCWVHTPTWSLSCDPP